MCVLLCLCDFVIDIFCFKQKTAYEMRISDWSSDVCSSDLGGAARAALARPADLADHHRLAGQRLPYLAIDIHDMCHRVVDADRHVFPVGQEMHGDEIDLLQQLRETRSEEHTSELQSLMRSSYAVF